MAIKPHKKSRNLSLYSNLAHTRRTKKDAAARKRAEYLASLPKHPVKRMLHRLHPKNFWGYWLSKRGLFMALKIMGVAVLLCILGAGALFAYFRRDIESLNPGEIAANVQTTVTKYYARDGKTLLWEDKGGSSYTLTVPGDKISKYMKQATIAIEDKDFYKHGGVSVSGTMRATVNNFGGGSTQGGSTLTQQLVKQVFFTESGEASERGLAGIPRKIKEAILSIEVERRYDKETILNLYLNESPYGGRRNGVESGAQTYFHKTAADLTIAEAALLAAIPQSPSKYDPYNTAGNATLVQRQHVVINNMVEQGYITKAEGDEAKKVAIIDTIHPEAAQFENIRAPHFTLMARQQLEEQLGKAAAGKGGYSVTTTLDPAIQDKLESQMKTMFNSSKPAWAGFTNGAASIEDTATGQVIALVGSHDFNAPGFGQDNAATTFIQPGSSIKPLVYAQLFQNQGPGQPNFGSGSILSDSRTTFEGNYSPNNADRKFLENIDLRDALARSRNIPAIKAMAIAGKEPTWKLIRDLGDKYYCTQGADKQAGLASAIGGCGTRLIDHTNAIASLGRMGVHKPWSVILEAKDSTGAVQIKQKDESKQVLDPQAAYITNDILGDSRARYPLGGNRDYMTQTNAAGIKVAAKTGTSDIDGQAKDLWTVAYTPHIALSIWLGNPDIRPLKQGNSQIPAEIADPVILFATQQYIANGRAQLGDWFTKPGGIQTINGELFPSYFNKSQGQTNAKMTFDKVSKKRATNCTPDAAKIEIDVTKTKDPFTKKDIIIAPSDYNANADDDTHKCDDVRPAVVGPVSVQKRGSKNYTIGVNIQAGTHPLQEVQIAVNGSVVATLPASASGGYQTQHSFSSSGPQQITVTVTDRVYYTGSASATYNVSGND